MPTNLRGRFLNRRQREPEEIQVSACKWVSGNRLRGRKNCFERRLSWPLTSKHKITELQRILEPLGIQVTTAELPEVEETGTTFEENAQLKARSACRATGLPSVADDSGISVDALGRWRRACIPPATPARDATDADRNQKLLRELQDTPDEKRTARFVSAICCAFPDGSEITVTGVCEGRVARAPRGEDGFGYDPIFPGGEKDICGTEPI